MADLTAIIVSYDSARWLDPCLRSLYARAGDCELEVIVVDNGSSDGSAELVERGFPQVRVIRSENRGFAHGNNVGLRAASAPYVLFINADTEVLDGTFAGLLDELRARPSIGLAGCRQVAADGSLHPSIRRFPAPGRLFFEALGSEQFPIRAPWLGERELDPAAYDLDVACDWTSGSFMLARRDAVVEAGLMDERYFIYCEEPDLCLRIKAAGWDVRHLPTMTILHHAGKGGFTPRLVAQDAYARRQYMAKNFSPGRRVLGTAALGFGHALRAVIGGLQPEQRPARRASSRAALRTLLGLAPPPFG